MPDVRVVKIEEEVKDEDEIEVEIGKATAEKHSIGMYKASEVKSWIVGIQAREHKLGRIDEAAKWNKALADDFVSWCISRGLTPNHGILGVIRRAAKIAARLGEEHAKYLINVLPPQYAAYWNEKKNQLISGYKAVRP